MHFICFIVFSVHSTFVKATDLNILIQKIFIGFIYTEANAIILSDAGNTMGSWVLEAVLFHTWHGFRSDWEHFRSSVQSV